jgi:hypothetical protein
MKNDVTTGLATKINEAHAEAVQAAQSALLHAREAGDLLLEAKAALPHGAWAEWLAEYVTFSDRTARGYMRVASRWEELPENGNGVADLSFRGALKLLAEPAETEDSLPDYLPGEGQHAFARTAGPVGTTLRAFIIPSAEHEGFYYTVVMLDTPDGGARVEGAAKPIRGAFVARALDGEFPADDVEWQYHLGAAWSYNEWVFLSHDDYVRRHILGLNLPNLERRIECDRDEMDRVRAAFTEIREHGLYRETHDTFEGYVNDRWPDAEVAMSLLNAEVGY